MNTAKPARRQVSELRAGRQLPAEGERNEARAPLVDRRQGRTLVARLECRPIWGASDGKRSNIADVGGRGRTCSRCRHHQHRTQSRRYGHIQHGRLRQGMGVPGSSFQAHSRIGPAGRVSRYAPSIRRPEHAGPEPGCCRSRSGGKGRRALSRLRAEHHSRDARPHCNAARPRRQTPRIRRDRREHQNYRAVSAYRQDAGGPPEGGGHDRSRPGTPQTGAAKRCRAREA